MGHHTRFFLNISALKSFRWLKPKILELSIPESLVETLVTGRMMHHLDLYSSSHEKISLVSSLFVPRPNQNCHKLDMHDSYEITFITLSVNITLSKLSFLVPNIGLVNKSSCIAVEITGSSKSKCETNTSLWN